MPRSGVPSCMLGSSTGNAGKGTQSAWGCHQLAPRLQNPAEGHTSAEYWPWPWWGGLPLWRTPMVHSSLKVWFCFREGGAWLCPKALTSASRWGGALCLPSRPPSLQLAPPEAVGDFRHAGGKGHLQYKSEKGKPGSRPTHDHSTARGPLGTFRPLRREDEGCRCFSNRGPERHEAPFAP